MCALGLLDTPRGAAFDRLVFVAAQVFHAPMAALALLDGERLWYKAQVGLAVSSVPRMSTFCDLALRQASPLLIEDAGLHPRHASAAAALQGGIRFYAGVPVLPPEGLCARLGVAPLPAGVLCVMDRRRRVVTAGQMGHLVQLAREATALLEAAAG